MAIKKKKENKPVEEKKKVKPDIVSTAAGKLERYQKALEYIRDYDMSKVAMTQAAAAALQE